MKDLPKCPKCGAEMQVLWNRHKENWYVSHPLPTWKCEDWSLTWHLGAKTEEEAVRLYLEQITVNESEQT